MSSVGSAAARRKGGGLPYFMFLCKGLNVQPKAWTRSWTSDTTATLSPPSFFLSSEAKLCLYSVVLHSSPCQFVSSSPSSLRDGTLM